MAKIAQASSCVIYVRMSQDRSGEELGIERHEKECRALAKKLKLRVEHVYKDNDLSATTGVARPEFTAMLEARPQAIIVWHQDRLLRLTSDLEKVIALGIPVHTVKSGMFDLSTPAGQATARTIQAWSQYEGEQKAIRQMSSNRQAAEHGYWQFSLRPFGYKRVNGKIVQVPAEADIIREGYASVIAGMSYRQVAKDWNERGIRPLLGEVWMPARVQRLLENSHYGGIQTYKGEEIELEKGKSIQWDPIVSPRVWKDFRELKLNRKRARSWGVSPKYLLSGMLTCGTCGGKIFTHAQDEMTRDVAAREAWFDLRTKEAAELGTKAPTKLSAKAPVFRDDGSRVKHTAYVCFEKYCVSIRGEYVDALARTIVLKELMDPRIVKATRTDDEITPLLDEIADLERQRDEVTEMVGLMDKTKARTKLQYLSDRLIRSHARLAALRAESPLSDIRLAEAIPEKWDALPVLERRRIMADLGLKMTINAADRGQRGIDPETGEKYSERAWALLRVTHVLDRA